MSSACFAGSGPAKTFKADAGNKHQLLYLMEGAGSINLENKNHEVTKGMGIYLGPSETATISATGSTVKIFHLRFRRFQSRGDSSADTATGTRKARCCSTGQSALPQLVQRCGSDAQSVADRPADIRFRLQTLGLNVLRSPRPELLV